MDGVSFKLFAFEDSPYICVIVDLSKPGTIDACKSWLKQGFKPEFTYNPLQLPKSVVNKSNQQAGILHAKYVSGEISLDQLIQFVNTQSSRVNLAGLRSSTTNNPLAYSLGGGGGEMITCFKNTNLSTPITEFVQLLVIAKFEGTTIITVDKAICFFTIKRSKYVFELFDLERNVLPVPYIKAFIGKTIPLLKAFIDMYALQRELINGTDILWLGAVEPKLATAYNKVGFTPCLNPSGVNGSSLPTPSIHTVSPLGTPFPKPGYSFIYSLKNPVSTLSSSAGGGGASASGSGSGGAAVAEILQLAKPCGLSIGVTDLKTMLSGTLCKIKLEILPSFVRTCYHDLVMGGTSESALLFAETKLLSGRDIEVRWNGNDFTANVQMQSATMPVEYHNHLIPMFTAAYKKDTVSRHVTGHTHPALLYVKDAILNTNTGQPVIPVNMQQDVSPPSLGDYAHTINTSSPLHLIWAAECVYSLRPDHTILAGVPPEITVMMQSPNFQNMFNRISTLFLTSHSIWDQTFKGEIAAKYGSLPELSELGTYIIKTATGIEHMLPNNPMYKRLQIAKLIFIRDKMNELFSINGVCFCKLKLHLYVKSGNFITSISPLPSCKTSTPNTLLVSDAGAIKEANNLQSDMNRHPPYIVTGTAAAATAAAGGGGGEGPLGFLGQGHRLTVNPLLLKSFAANILMPISQEDLNGLMQHIQMGKGRRMKRRIHRRKNTMRHRNNKNRKNKKSRKNKH